MNSWPWSAGGHHPRGDNLRRGGHPGADNSDRHPPAPQEAREGEEGVKRRRQNKDKTPPDGRRFYFISHGIGARAYCAAQTARRAVGGAPWSPPAFKAGQKAFTPWARARQGRDRPCPPAPRPARLLRPRHGEVHDQRHDYAQRRVQHAVERIGVGRGVAYVIYRGAQKHHARQSPRSEGFFIAIVLMMTGMSISETMR